MPVSLVTDGLTFNNHHSTIPGTFLVEVVDAVWAVPVATCYWRHTYDRKIEILYVNVVEQLRRKRIATKIVEHLRDMYPNYPFVTQVATELAKPWLEKTGWKKVEYQSRKLIYYYELWPHTETPAAQWEVVGDDDGQMWRVRWSKPGQGGRFLFVGHYPQKHFAEHEAEKLNREGRRPEEWDCYKPEN